MIVLRALAVGDEAELLRIHRTPEVARWWDEPAPGFPWDEPESTRFTIEVDGRIAGLIQYWEETEPRYRHAGIDLFLDPSLHGRGIGAEVVARVVHHLIEERGHHRITIDPAAANAAAIRCYEKVGFGRVGVLRSYERDAGADSWHDGLLMELIAHPEAQQHGSIAETLRIRFRGAELDPQRSKRAGRPRQPTALRRPRRRAG